MTTHSNCILIRPWRMRFPYIRHLSTGMVETGVTGSGYSWPHIDQAAFPFGRLYSRKSTAVTAPPVIAERRLAIP